MSVWAHVSQLVFLFVSVGEEDGMPEGFDHLPENPDEPDVSVSFAQGLSMVG